MTLLQTELPPIAKWLTDLGVPYAQLLGQAITFLLVFFIVYVVGRLTILPLVNRLLASRDMDVHARRPLWKLTRAVVFFVAIAVAFGFAGFGSFLQSLATIAAAATLAIGFALQNVIRNFVAGIFIFTDRPFRIGDWIEWDGFAGEVEDISLRVTRVKTFDNELLTVPNSQLTENVIKNPVAKDRLRLKFVFDIGYEDDIGEATEIIIEEAEAHDGIMDDPGPSVRLIELDDSSVGLQSRIWIDNPSRSDFTKVRGEYIKAVKERFDEAGIEIPYPQLDVSGGLDLDNVEGIAEPAAED